MTKKSNRSKSKAARPAVKPAAVESEPEDAAPIMTAAEVRAPRSPKLTRSQAAAERIEDEYAYITGDLRRVFILAAAMFLLLIAINLVVGLLG